MHLDLDRKRLLSNDIPNGNGVRHLRATVGTFASFIVVLLAASTASAATLIVSGGQLLGASGVVVGGGLYNVEFLDGTCIALYSGCDEVADFTFESSAGAFSASLALLDQVFLNVAAGDFDIDPSLTRGCEISICFSVTPWAPTTTAEFRFVASRNDTDELTGTVILGVNPNTRDYFTVPQTVFAVWTVVPEPGTAVLMGLGLLGLSAHKRRDG